MEIFKMAIQKEKEELIEMFGNHFEFHMHFSPLSSRILANLIVDCPKKGMTFDDLVIALGASKSSVSTNLNLLLKSRKIQYNTYPGDRKKYFRPSSFSDRMGSHLQWVLDEKKIVERMINFRKNTSDEMEDCNDIERIKIYQDHIFDLEKFLNKTIDKLNKVEQR